jgi:hypothetical protein
MPHKSVIERLGCTCSPKCFINIKNVTLSLTVLLTAFNWFLAHPPHPRNHAAFIGLKVSKRMTSTGIVQKNSVALNWLYENVPGSIAPVVYFVHYLRHIIGLNCNWPRCGNYWHGSALWAEKKNFVKLSVANIIRNLKLEPSNLKCCCSLGRPDSINGNSAKLFNGSPII